MKLMKALIKEQENSKKTIEQEIQTINEVNFDLSKTLTDER